MLGPSNPRHARVANVAALVAVLTACERSTAVPAEVESVRVEPERVTLVEGSRRDLRAVALGSGGAELIGRTVTWATDDPDVATVGAAGSLMAVRSGGTVVRATVEGVEGEAMVTVEAGPLIVVQPVTVALTAVAGGASQVEFVSVTNGGGSLLSGLSVEAQYPEAGPVDWLAAGLSGTTAPVDLSLSGAAASMGPGAYLATALVRSPVAGGLTAAVDVEFTVVPPPPLIELGAEAVFFGAIAGGQIPAEQVVAVTNGGGGVLDGLEASLGYGEGQPEGWLEVVLTSPEAPAELQLRASPGSLSPGTYHASVEVRTDLVGVEPRTLSVEFEVDPGVEFQVDPGRAAPVRPNRPLTGLDRPAG